MTRNALQLITVLVFSQWMLSACTAHDTHLPTGDVRKYGDGSEVSNAENQAPHHFKTEYAADQSSRLTESK
ncbi:MAG: hypothetical protein HOM11_16490 [Methylococcales bacterium]|nr:hypothetical protein [Methylococcales bacterium]MBT7444046.1 hypothetical protein [Methylococcales bacterium]